MDIAYVITAGEYSDYGIIAVFMNRDVAERFKAMYDANKKYSFEQCNIEEYPIGVDFSIMNMMDYELSQNKSSGYISILLSSISAVSTFKEFNVVRDTGMCLTVCVRVPLAKGKEEHAKKIAADLFAKYKAENEGIS